MNATLSQIAPHVVCLLFLAAYIGIWCLISNDWLWLVVSSAACMWFIRYTVSLSYVEQFMLPPWALLLATLHWGVVYMTLFNRRVNL